MDFPTLSRQPAKGIQEGRKNPGDLKHEDDAGYVTTRRRFTRMPKTFSFALAGLTLADRLLLDNFIAAQSTVGAFNWVNPVDDITYVVRFSSIPVIATTPPYSRAQIELEEV